MKISGLVYLWIHIYMTVSCPDNCKTCQQGSIWCATCNDGYYTNGGRCYTCGHTGCLCTEDQSCYGCRDGFYFTKKYIVANTCTPCMTSCRSCTNDDSCSACRPGFYGRRCEQPCSPRCADPCDMYGNCRCKPNFADPLCEKCIDGFYGENCSQQCSANCIACSDENYCISCKKGYYGPKCQLSCSSSCANGACNKQSGHCSSCVIGYTGSTCNDTCSIGCLYDTCYQLTGRCTCKNGFHGDKCEYSCPPNCQLCTSMTYCSECKDGFYGLTCEHNCSEGCASCDGNGMCVSCKANYSNTKKQCQCSIGLCASFPCMTCTNTTFYPNGNECCPCRKNCKHGLCTSDFKCTQGCKDGYYGAACQSECTNRDPNCTACIGETNTKSSCTHCKNGTFPGTNGMCTPCSTTCWAGYCNSSGYCQYGCQDGYWGKKCDLKCKAHCIACDQRNGTCVRCLSSRYYGDECNMSCNSNCFNWSCHQNGTCAVGCIANFYGSSCETPCSEHCARFKNESRCSYETGNCMFGCVEGFTGYTCMQALQQGSDGRTLPYAAIGAGSAALLIVVIAVAIGVVVCVRRRDRKPKSNSVNEASKNDADSLAPVYSTVTRNAPETRGSVYENTSSVKVNIAMEQMQHAVYSNSPVEKNVALEEMTSSTEDTLEIDEWDSIARQHAIRFEENGGVYYNDDEKVKNQKIPVTELREFVMSKNLDFFKTEFEKLPYGLLKDCNVSQLKANLGKNRYKDIYPYDDHRVKVIGGASDYINASFIDGYKRINEYIATLGPMSKQLGNFGLFWSMVWQHKVEKIVMLTNLVEEGFKDKCEQYWPSIGATKMYGDILVSCQSGDEYAEFTRRIFKVVKDKETRTMTQLHFTSWPDKDVPEDVTSIIEFRQNVIRAPATLGGPTIVHCSAGVGRTGTYIAIDILTKEGEAAGAVDIPGCVLNMRQNRPNMVQTAGQYEYLHHAVVHSLTFNCKPVAGAKFQSYMDTTSQEQIMNKFHQLQETTTRVSPDEAMAIERNAQFIDKNREESDIPGDEHRPRLFLNLKLGSTDYVNAVYVNSFQTKDKYILAQSPLPNTVDDFLALIAQTNCSCVVSFEPASMHAMGIGVYLPADNQILKKGIFSVRCSKPEANAYRIKRTFTIEQHENEAGDVASSITHLEFTDWDKEHNVPRSTVHYRRLIDEVDDVMARTDSHRPILIHCLDGASKCGLFFVVATLLQTMDVDHEVSVENAVRKVKTRRKGAIPNLEQFQFCHSCVLDYIQSFDIYSNFAADVSDGAL